MERGDGAGPCERGVIFTGANVRAILDGRKTQTRRILKPQPREWKAQVIDISRPMQDEEGVWGQVRTEWSSPSFEMPYGEPEREIWESIKLPCYVGDRLWMKETCGRRPASFLGIEATNGVESAFYKADDEDVLDERGFNLCPWWRGPTLSPIHMPRWASRLTLAVTDVRVQRLQDISEADADAEGFAGDFVWKLAPDVFTEPHERWGELTIPECYGVLWDSIHGTGAWDANPWVAAISFEVFDAPAAGERATAGRAGDGHG